MSLKSVLRKYDTDKNDTYHDYGTYYERFFEPYKDTCQKYLEIGVFHGESLRAMREYFANAEKIVGIDVNPDATQHADPDRGLFVEIGDQSDAAFLRAVHEKHGPFDVILDDGSHRFEDIKASFETLFPLLKDNGMYVIEDAVCIRNNLGYFADLARHGMHWKMDETGSWDHTVVDPHKFVFKTSDPMAYSMGDITFSNSCILITKRVKQHWIV